MLSFTKSRLAGKTLLQTLFFFLLVTQICFAQWVPVGLEDENIKDMAIQNSNIFAVTSDSGKVNRSTDNGNNWTVIVDSGAIHIAVSSSGMVFLVKESDPIWGYPTSSLFSSSNNGDIWDTVNVLEQLPPVPGGWPAWPITVSVSQLNLIACGIYVTHDIGGHLTRFALSTDDGSTWILSSWDLDGGVLFDFRDQRMITFGGSYSQVGFGEYTNLSYDNGQTWFVRFAPYPTTRTLNLCLNGNILAGTYDSWAGGGLNLSVDSCITWTQVSSVIPQTSLSIETGGTLVGTESLGIFLFSDDGDSLGTRNGGLTNLNIHSLKIDNNYVYAGTVNGVWRRPLSEIVTSIKEISTTFPSEYLLTQNYPNPFNPSTKIKYSVPQSSQVQIKVFDVLGNVIETLVNEEKPIGTYELTWNAVDFPSGIYFYQLKAGSLVETKKMVLMK